MRCSARSRRKAGSPTFKLVVLGTLAPMARLGPGHWWFRPDRRRDNRHHVTCRAFQGDRKRWDQWGEIRHGATRCRRSRYRSGALAATGDEDAARRDSATQGAFPISVSAQRARRPKNPRAVLLDRSVRMWERCPGLAVSGRLPEPDGKLSGRRLTLGAGRCMVGGRGYVWRNGRTEALASLVSGVAEYR